MVELTLIVRQLIVPAIFERILTRHQDQVDLSSTEIENFYPVESKEKEAPVLTGDVQPLEPGALVICNVSPFRVDMMLPGAAHNLFARVSTG